MRNTYNQKGTLAIENTSYPLNLPTGLTDKEMGGWTMDEMKPNPLEMAADLLLGY